MDTCRTDSSCAEEVIESGTMNAIPPPNRASGPTKETGRDQYHKTLHVPILVPLAVGLVRLADIVIVEYFGIPAQ
jgi:hypothetical protein